ncbi:hypothetical protein AUJ14_03830 [Candidatus Micrarchaeota archaeon CG1_02_55_22]|nr:MAG: hypothetical protein AUJ14_03830 [Candidatus Micrarchaeota archaeon CG1_02_55_22]
MAEAKRLLILCIDVDADLQEKAKIRGPVVGRKANIEAATKLALTDPEEVDANTIFSAVKLYDELGKENTVEVATLTGSPALGYTADKEVVKQLEKVISDFKPEACVFVSDGASDERIMPLVQTRVKINSVETVYVKQSKDLEKTYFVILDKLKEPAFARIVFGLPGAALLFYFLLGNTGIRYFIGLLGAYLILRALGIEDWLAKTLAHTKVSFDRISSVFYFAAVPLLLVALGLGYANAAASESANALKLAAFFTKELFLAVVALLLIILGTTLEAYYEKKAYEYPEQLINASAIVLLWLMLNSAADWIIGNTSFSDFFSALLLIVAVMFLVIFLAKEFKKDIISRLKLEGREVYTELGTRLGKIVSINKRKDTFIIQTEQGQNFDLEFDHISNLGEKVIIRY